MKQAVLKRREIVYRRPVEVVDGAIPSPLPSVGWSIAAAAAVMLLLGSNGLLNWANDLPVGSISDSLSNLAQIWQDAMNRAGLTHFAEFLRHAWRLFQELH